MKTQTIILTRHNIHEGSTAGVMRLPSGKKLFTLEPPALTEYGLKSCIAPGSYLLIWRKSPLMERISSGKQNETWEVSRVPGRTAILIHPGNTTEDTTGCILVGMAMIATQHGVALHRSRDAFQELLNSLSPEHPASILIE